MKSCIGVFKKVVGEYVYILMGFVDDILACAKPDELEHIKKACIKEFKWIMMDVGEKHSYLGMQRAKVDMRFYIKKILADYRELKEYVVPGDKVVARLLYLAKLVRPDILAVVCFLCTRVKELTVEDAQKHLA